MLEKYTALLWWSGWERRASSSKHKNLLAQFKTRKLLDKYINIVLKQNVSFTKRLNLKVSCGLFCFFWELMGPRSSYWLWNKREWYTAYRLKVSEIILVEISVNGLVTHEWHELTFVLPLEASHLGTIQKATMCGTTYISSPFEITLMISD